MNGCKKTDSNMLTCAWSSALAGGGSETQDLSARLLPDGSRLKVEIYEMQSPAPAYGMFTFKAGESGEPEDIGQSPVFDGDYLNFWKGRLLCNIVVQNSNEKYRQADLVMAKGWMPLYPGGHQYRYG